MEYLHRPCRRAERRATTLLLEWHCICGCESTPVDCKLLCLKPEIYCCHWQDRIIRCNGTISKLRQQIIIINVFTGFKTNGRCRVGIVCLWQFTVIPHHCYSERSKDRCNNRMPFTQGQEKRVGHLPLSLSLIPPVTLSCLKRVSVILFQDGSPSQRGNFWSSMDNWIIICCLLCACVYVHVRVRVWLLCHPMLIFIGINFY